MSRNNRAFAQQRKKSPARVFQPDPFVAKTLQQRFEEGKALEKEGKHVESGRIYSELVSSFERLKLNAATPNAALGYALLRQNKLEEAEKVLKRSIKLDPNLIEGHINLGAVYRSLELWPQCEAACRRALKINERDTRARLNLAEAQLRAGQYGPAVQSFLLVLSLDSENVEARKGIAEAYVSLGDPDVSIPMFRKVFEMDPDSWPLRSHMLFALQYDPAAPNEEVLDEHLTYGKRVREVVGPPRTQFPNSTNPDRVLRVGYLSADFKYHVVMRFVQHVIELHDRSRVEVFCIAANRAKDYVTDEIKAITDHWIDIAKLNDEEAARLILDLQLDILVDLTGHTSVSRLALLGRRLAPVQAVWCGYSGTTGLDSVDYIIVDDIIAPDGEKTFFVEEPIRLPTSYLSFAPAGEVPDITPLPYDKNGYITFGCMNNPSKVNKYVIAWWAEILRLVPNSRLLLRYGLLRDPLVKERILKLLRASGVPSDRYTVKEGESVFLRVYDDVDIALDTFPYNGTTTTCEALYMGVPVVTLRGDRFVARVGASLLTKAGLGDLVARNPLEYVAKAVKLASETEQLKTFRREARAALSERPIFNKQVFTRAIENAYAQMFRSWCEKQRGLENGGNCSESSDMELVAQTVD